MDLGLQGQGAKGAIAARGQEDPDRCAKDIAAAGAGAPPQRHSVHRRS
ncbi:MAG: hypothetical protein OEZ08_00470 [Betaproteobacteria bacterium]|nr:hypothetical protein [Betaproteobacteria bacterium]